MAKFRKKVEEFEAWQWTGEGCVVPGIEAVFDRDDSKPNGGTNRYFIVSADSNRYYLSPNDWVLKDKAGYYYVVSNEYINRYEKVEE